MEMVRKVVRKNTKGFTLIEMMIVLLIISILLLIAVPNLTKNKKMANEKGCEATIELIKTQMIAYEIEKEEAIQSNEDLDKLVSEKYVDTLKCPNGDKVTMEKLEFQTRDEDAEE